MRAASISSATQSAALWTAHSKRRIEVVVARSEAAQAQTHVAGSSARNALNASQPTIGM